MSLRDFTSNINIQDLPDDIIIEIVNYLSIDDVLKLTSVSKTWRHKLLNQNIIWKRICDQFNIQEKFYFKENPLCISKTLFSFKSYFDIKSEIMFGPCRWWKIYNSYFTVLDNLKTGQITSSCIQYLKPAKHFYCTDDYIINLKTPWSFNVCYLSGHPLELLRKTININGSFKELLIKKWSSLLTHSRDPILLANKKYLVIGISTVICVYSIKNNKLSYNYSKIFNTPQPTKLGPRHIQEKFLNTFSESAIDLYDDKLALVKLKKNLVFIIDLKHGKICKEFVYCSNNNCKLNCLKIHENKLMVGFSYKPEKKNGDKLCEFAAIVYDLVTNTEITVFLQGFAKEFIVNNDFIGIKNSHTETPLINTSTKSVMWIDCTTFSIDTSGKFIYYYKAINLSLIKFDLENFQEFILNELASTNEINYIKSINDRFIIRTYNSSSSQNTYDIFDLKTNCVSKTIRTRKKYKLVYIGTHFLVLAHRVHFRIHGFGW